LGVRPRKRIKLRLPRRRRRRSSGRKEWGALKKAWKGYKIAHAKGDLDKKAHYAWLVNKLQGELGLKITRFRDFPEFYEEM